MNYMRIFTHARITQFVQTVMVASIFAIFSDLLDILYDIFFVKL